MEFDAIAYSPVKATLIGCGLMAAYHLRTILPNFENTHFPVVSEPSPKAYEAIANQFIADGRPKPANEPDIAGLLDKYAGELDAAFIITPHVYHHDQAKACMEAGLDVLLEKPMVMNVTEAESLIDVRDRTGRLLVVAFNGSLSPEIREAARLLRSGQCGSIISISATVWQNWRQLNVNTWRQEPALSGGGFLFDTGAHMLNTVSDLAGEEFVEVVAWQDNRGSAVDINSVVLARLASGALVTLHGSGETVPSCASDVRVFCSQAIVRTGVWGKSLEIQRHGASDFEKVNVPPSTGVWEQFLSVREGRIENPCPPEIGLRMARLWGAIQLSAKDKGVPVRIETGA